MVPFGTFYLDKEKDIIVELYRQSDSLSYVLRTPNHAKGNLITNLARLCHLPLSTGEDGLKVIRGEVPCYIDERNHEVYVLRLADTKVANIYPDATIERKAYIPAISKTLMSQTKDYRLDSRKTLVKTYIRREYKFRTDLHTHMNANLDADLLIALGIYHQIRYPLYYIKKLRLRCSAQQQEMLAKQREKVAAQYADAPLSGKYLTRKIDSFLATGANFLLNVGPKADGTIPDESRAIMADVGKWYRRVRDSYRNVETVSGMVTKGQAVVTRRGDTLFVHFPKGLDASGLDLAPLDVLPKTATLLNTGAPLKARVELMPWSALKGKETLHVWGIPADELSNECIVLRLDFAPGALK